MTSNELPIQQQLAVEDARLAQRIRRWTVVPAVMGVLLLGASTISSWRAISRVRDANVQVRLASDSVDTLRRVIAALDAEAAAKLLVLRQVIAKQNANIAQTSGEGAARRALEQAVGSTPGADSVVPIVYIQFRGGLRRSVPEGLRAELNRAGYSAPGTERVDRAFSSGVYYFRAADSALAQSVADQSQAYFRARGCPVEFALHFAPRFAPTTKPRQVELWVNANCPGQT